MARKQDLILYDLMRLPWWVSGVDLLFMFGLNGFWIARAADADDGMFKPLIPAVSMFIQITMFVCAAGLALSVAGTAWMWLMKRY